MAAILPAKRSGFLEGLKTGGDFYTQMLSQANKAKTLEMQQQNLLDTLENSKSRRKYYASMGKLNELKNQEAALGIAALQREADPEYIAEQQALTAAKVRDAQATAGTKEENLKAMQVDAEFQKQSGAVARAHALIQMSEAGKVPPGALKKILKQPNAVEHYSEAGLALLRAYADKGLTGQQAAVELMRSQGWSPKQINQYLVITSRQQTDDEAALQKAIDHYLAMGDDAKAAAAQAQLTSFRNFRLAWQQQLLDVPGQLGQPEQPSKGAHKPPLRFQNFSLGKINRYVNYLIASEITIGGVPDKTRDSVLRWLHYEKKFITQEQYLKLRETP